MNKNFSNSVFKRTLTLNKKKADTTIPFFEEDSGGLLTIDGKKIIFVSIIDLFTQYG
jgi:hypothetical protein